MSTGSKILLCVIAVGFSALFVRLGFWQLSRHEVRSAGVEMRADRATEPTLQWGRATDLPPDTAGFVGRQARLVGRWDPAHEVILRSRTLDGRAGVEILTPFTIAAGEDGAPDAGATVMVLRGWVAAADGLRADLTSTWPDASDRGEVAGVLISSRNGRGGPPLWVDVAGSEHLALGGIDLDQIRNELDLDVSIHVLRADDPELGGGALRPAREIEAGLGSHLSYTFQWFSFAVITLVGTAILIRKERRRE